MIHHIGRITLDLVIFNSSHLISKDFPSTVKAFPNVREEKLLRTWCTTLHASPSFFHPFSVASYLIISVRLVSQAVSILLLNQFWQLPPFSRVFPSQHEFSK